MFQVSILEFKDRPDRPLYHLEHFIDGKYKCIIKYIAIDPKTKAFCSRTDENSFDTKDEGIKWLNNKTKELDHDISIYDDEVMQLKKSYEDIMTKYGDGFKWCDNDDTKSDDKLNNYIKKIKSNKNIDNLIKIRDKYI